MIMKLFSNYNISQCVKQGWKLEKSSTKVKKIKGDYFKLCQVKSQVND